MAYRSKTRKIAYKFEILIDYDGGERKDRRYTAYSKELAGCSVRAGTEAKAVRRTKTAIGAWICTAKRAIAYDTRGIADAISSEIYD